MFLIRESLASYHFPLVRGGGMILVAMLLVSTTLAEDRVIVVGDNVPRLASVAVEELGALRKVMLGRLVFGKQYRFILPIVNNSGVDWLIQDVWTDCGCTAGVPASKRINAGEASSLVLSIEPKRTGRFEIALTILLDNKQASDVKLGLTGICLDDFTLEKKRFVIERGTRTIESTVRSNFVSFDQIGRIDISHGIFETASLTGKGSHTRRLVATLSSEFLESNQRRANTRVVLDAGDIRSDFQIEIVRRDVIEMRPNILVFQKTDGGDMIAKCFLRGEESKLNGIGESVSIVGRMELGTIEAKLVVGKVHGDLALCDIRVRESFLPVLRKKQNNGVDWIIDGFSPLRTLIAVDP